MVEAVNWGRSKSNLFGQERNYRLIYHAERELEEAEIEYAYRAASFPFLHLLTWIHQGVD